MSSTTSPNTNPEAEVSVLGACLIDADAITAVVDQLAPADFYVDAHRLIWGAIQALANAQEPVDLITVNKYLIRTQAQEAAGGATYLAELANAVHTTANVEHHADLVAEQARARRLGLALQEGIANLRVGMPPADVAANIEAFVAHSGAAIGRRSADILDPDELLALPEPEYLIEGFLPRNALVMLYGAPGAAKTFLALRMAMSIAMGWQFRNKPVTDTGLVLYIAGEGINGIKMRAHAWQDHTAERITGFYTHKGAVNLSEHAAVMALLGKIRRLPEMPRLIVFDTLARCMGGVDENSAQETGAVIAALDLIKEATGATILVLHHSRKDDPSIYRGSSAIEGAVDAMFYLGHDRDTGARTLRCIKLKEDDPTPDTDWELTKVGASAVIVTAGEATETERVGGAIPKKARHLTPIEQGIIDVITDAPNGLTKAEVQRATDFDFSTVKKAVDRLFNWHLLVRDPETKRFKPKGRPFTPAITTSDPRDPLLFPKGNGLHSPSIPPVPPRGNDPVPPPFPLHTGETPGASIHAGQSGGMDTVPPPFPLFPSATPGGGTGSPPYGVGGSVPPGDPAAFGGPPMDGLIPDAPRSEKFTPLPSVTPTKPDFQEDL